MSVIIDLSVNKKKVSIKLDDLIIHTLNDKGIIQLGFVYCMVEYFRNIGKYADFISEEVYLSLRKAVRKHWNSLPPIYKDFLTKYYERMDEAPKNDYPTSILNDSIVWHNRFESNYFNQESVNYIRAL